MVRRAERSPQYRLGPMWTMYNSFRATLGLEQPAAALAPLCTPARAGRPDTARLLCCRPESEAADSCHACTAA